MILVLINGNWSAGNSPFHHLRVVQVDLHEVLLLSVEAVKRPEDRQTVITSPSFTHKPFRNESLTCQRLAPLWRRAGRWRRGFPWRRWGLCRCWKPPAAGGARGAAHIHRTARRCTEKCRGDGDMFSDLQHKHSRWREDSELRRFPLWPVGDIWQLLHEHGLKKKDNKNNYKEIYNLNHFCPFSPCRFLKQYCYKLCVMRSWFPFKNFNPDGNKTLVWLNHILKNSLIWSHIS